MLLQPLYRTVLCECMMCHERLDCAGGFIQKCWACHPLLQADSILLLYVDKCAIPALQSKLCTRFCSTFRWTQGSFLKMCILGVQHDEVIILHRVICQNRLQTPTDFSGEVSRIILILKMMNGWMSHISPPTPMP